MDMDRVRYGSCVYYACYPQYLALVNATGGRYFRDPLAQFSPYAVCETMAAKAVRRRGGRVDGSDGGSADAHWMNC